MSDETDKYVQQVENAPTPQRVRRIAHDAAFAMTSIGWIGGVVAASLVARYESWWAWVVGVVIALSSGAWGRAIARSLARSAMATGIKGGIEASDKAIRRLGRDRE